VITEVLINGAPSDGRIPVTDSAVLRGDGCFEVLKSYGGKAFALDAHIERLQASAAALQIELPDRSDLILWIEKTAAEVGTGAVRVVVTRGASVPGRDDPSKVIVFGHGWDIPDRPARLYPVVAPWHAAGAAWDLAGAKITSYGPNMAAARRARDEGFDDALLLTTSSVILEGPTFSIAWVVEGVLETPNLDLGILDSITRRLVLDLAREAGTDVVEGRWDLERLEAASEAMALSTIREVQPVVAVGQTTWEPGPVTDLLARGYAALIG